MRYPIAILGLTLLISNAAHGESIWIEGEKPAKSTMNRHPWWYDQVKKEHLSGGDWISNFDPKKVGEAEYVLTAKEAGTFEFWVRANPTLSTLSYRLNDLKDFRPIDFEKSSKEATNIAADGKLDLRFIAWVKVGTVELKRGKNVIRFRMSGDHSHHGGLDCFVLSTDPFTPRGLLKPGETAKEPVSTEADWFAFDPSADTFTATSAIDLRFLNEKQAGENGFITSKAGKFIQGHKGQSVRFWAVNGVAAKTHDELKLEARQLAKYGVTLSDCTGRCSTNGVKWIPRKFNGPLKSSKQ